MQTTYPEQYRPQFEFQLRYCLSSYVIMPHHSTRKSLFSACLLKSQEISCYQTNDHHLQLNSL